MWPTFARHHYLNSNLHRSAQCFVARWCGTPVAFCATLPLPGRRNHWRITRIVTLPDYQGVGIGTRVMEAVANLYRQKDCRVNITASHPSLIAHCHRSPNWRLLKVAKAGTRLPQRSIGKTTASTLRATASFEYVEANPRTVAGEKIQFCSKKQGSNEHLPLEKTARCDSDATVASVEIQNLSGKTSVSKPSLSPTTPLCHLTKKEK
jgi:GNAT superfamily N-acetyltransferase